MSIEDTLKGGYKGLYGEVVTHDSYKIRNLKFVPDLIFDIGANIGIFSRYARTLFPDATIVAVEPHPENVREFVRYTDVKNIFLLPVALGTGNLWHNKGAVNGSGESYVSSGLGYDDEEMKDCTSTEKSKIDTIMLPDLMLGFYKHGLRTLMKIDCEGGENVIWDDRASMSVLRQMDYIAMETHFYALHGGPLYDHMRLTTLMGIEWLKKTHHVDFTHPYLFATKKFNIH